MEINFHLKPTQINRQNPIVAKYTGLTNIYMYHLKGDFYIRFATVGDTSVAGLVKTDNPMNLNVRAGDYTVFDIHSKKDLVNYVTSYRKLPIEEIERVYNITF